MAFLRPHIIKHRISDIPLDFLREKGIKALLLDVDNTLTTHNNPQPDTVILAWLEQVRQAGIAMMLVSNNAGPRVAKFAQKLNMPYTARAAKPLPFGFWRAAKQLGVKPRETLVIGDQIFTDIWGGRLFGAQTVWVQPIEPETGPFFRLKRRWEARFYTTQNK